MKKMVLATVITAMGLCLVFGGSLFSQSEKILAKVGDRVITQKEMNDLIDKYVKYKPKKGEAVSQEEKKQILDRMISGIMFAKEAEKEKLGETAEIKEKIRAFREELLIQEYIKLKVAPTVVVTDGEIEEKLKSNPQLAPKVSLRMREIVVKTEKEAMEIYGKLVKGEDFVKLATAKSIGSTADMGGALKMLVSKGMWPKPLEDAAFALGRGEFSMPVKTDKGYTILFLVDKIERSPAEMKDLEDTVKGKIRQIEATRKLEGAIAKRAEELKKGYKIEVHYDQIQ
jgi:parvulin-like peptidyl-prolyl isomerase